MVSRLFRMFSTKAFGEMKTVSDVVLYARQNEKSLKGKDVYSLLNKAVALAKPAELKEIPEIYTLIKLGKAKKITSELNTRELIALAKHYADMDLALGKEWKELLVKVSGRLFELDSGLLLELMRYTANMRKGTEAEAIWKKLLGELVEKAWSCTADEMCEIFEFAVELKVTSEGLWKKLEVKLSEKVEGLTKEQALRVLESYKAIGRDQSEVIKMLKDYKLTLT